jgi:hypothetical protein
MARASVKSAYRRMHAFPPLERSMVPDPPLRIPGEPRERKYAMIDKGGGKAEGIVGKIE